MPLGRRVGFRRSRRSRRSHTSRLSRVSTVANSSRRSIMSEDIKLRIHKPLSHNTIPPKLTTEHRYCDFFSLQTAPAGAMLAQDFMLNSMYDPDITNTGHQPFYRDQLAQLYTKYKVVKVKLHGYAVENAYNYAPVGIASIYGEDLGGTNSDIQYLWERPHCKPMVLRSEKITLAKTKWLKVAKLLNLSDLEYASDSYAVAVGSNPSQPAYWRIMLRSIDSASQPYVTIIVDMRFVVEWSEPVAVASS